VKVFGLLDSEKKLIVSLFHDASRIYSCQDANVPPENKTFESLSLDFSEMDVPFMFLGGTITKAKGDYNPNRYYI